MNSPKLIKGWNLFGSAAIVLGVAGCKPSQDSGQLKTLDNFTSSSKTVNVCFGPFHKTTITPKIEVAQSVTIDKKREGVYRDATLLALSAVPDPVKSIFAAQKGAVIRLTDNVSDICGQKLARIDQAWASEGGRLSSCWESTAENLAIYLEASPTAIQHHLVRTLARISAEVVATAIEEGKVSSGPRNDSVERVKNFRAFQRELSDALMMDVANARAAGSKANLDQYADLILSDDEKDRRIFDHFVFAESFDSYYCNSEKGGTRESFQKNFPSAFAVFKKITSHLESDPKLLEGLSKLTPNDVNQIDSGFNLGIGKWFSPSWWLGYEKSEQAVDKSVRAFRRSNDIAHEITLGKPAYKEKPGTSIRDFQGSRIEGLSGAGAIAEEGIGKIVGVIPGASRGATLAKDGVRGLVISEASGRVAKGAGQAVPSVVSRPVENVTKSATRGVLGRMWDWIYGAPKATP